MEKNLPVDILIHDASLLPLPDPSQFIPRGWLTIKENRVVSVSAGDPPAMVAQRRIDARGCLAMAGLVNGHTHAPMSLFRGLADDIPLKAWLEEYIFPTEGKWVNEEFVYWEPSWLAPK